MAYDTRGAESIDELRLLSGFVPADPDLTSGVRRRATALWHVQPDALVATPGRIEIVGNHVDYNGGEVVAAAIDRWVSVAARKRDDDTIHVSAPDAGVAVGIVPLADALIFDRRQSSIERQWTDYAQASVAALSAAGHTVGGLDLYYRGTIPLGSGLSSSSALLVGLVAATVRASGFELDKLTIARIAQDAEHRTGAPVGLLDQTSSAVGGVLRFSNDPDRVRLLNANLGDAVFLVCDSGVRHTIPGSRYPQRVEECQHAVRLLREAGFAIESLAALPLTELDRALALLPEPLDARVRHVVEEVERTARAERAIVDGDRELLGRLMNESGHSSATLYDISHQAVEAIVAAAQAVPGVYGARMMGGGDGGSAIVLAERDAVERLEETLSSSSVTVCRVSRGLTYID